MPAGDVSQPTAWYRTLAPRTWSAPRVRARLATRRCGGRRHGGGVPGPAGHGVRRSGWSRTRRWPVGDPAGPRAVCRTGLVPATVRGSGIDHSTHDRDRDRSPGGRGRRAIRRLGRDPRARRWGDRDRRVDPAPRLRLRPAVATDPGGVPVRRRDHHDRRTAGEDHGCPCRGRDLACRGCCLRTQHRGHARADAGDGSGDPGLPPPRSALVSSPARSAAGGPPRERQHRPL